MGYLLDVSMARIKKLHRVSEGVKKATRGTLALLEGCKMCSLAFPPKVKHRITICSRNSNTQEKIFLQVKKNYL